MTLYDICLKVPLEDAKLIEAVRATIHFKSNAPIFFIAEETEEIDWPKHLDWSFIKKRLPGEFSLWLQVGYPEAASDFDWDAWAGRFCKAANVDALISDDSVNPYSWTLIDHLGSFTHVHTDTEYFAETGGFRDLQKNAPLEENDRISDG